MPVPRLFTDLYELTMAQAYFRKGMDRTGYFEVFVRHLPEHWGFFVMAGLHGGGKLPAGVPLLR